MPRILICEDEDDSRIAALLAHGLAAHKAGERRLAASFVKAEQILAVVLAECDAGARLIENAFEPCINVHDRSPVAKNGDDGLRMWNTRFSLVLELVLSWLDQIGKRNAGN